MYTRGFPGGSVIKNLPAHAVGARAAGLIPGSGRSPGGGNGYPLQHSCLENSMDRGTWRATVQMVAESDMTEQLSIHIKQHHQKKKRKINCHILPYTHFRSSGIFKCKTFKCNTKN